MLLYAMELTVLELFFLGTFVGQSRPRVNHGLGMAKGFRAAFQSQGVLGRPSSPPPPCK